MEKIFQNKPVSVPLVRRLILLGIILLIGVYSHSQTVKDSLKHHVIVLLDRSGSVDRDSQIPEYMARDMIKYRLKKVCFLKNETLKKFLPVERLLLEKGDYLSVLSFGFDKYDPSVDDFIETIPFHNKLEVTLEDAYDENIFSNLWNYIDDINYKRFFDKNWTGLSFAGAHALNALNSKTNPKDVGRTFIIIVTDGDFNGLGDPNLELNNLINYWDDNNVTVENREKIIPKYNQIKQAFTWNKIYDDETNPGMKKRNYKLEIIEYKPLQQTFAIEAVVPLESELVFRRTPQKSYQKDFNVSINQNSTFQIERMNLQIKDTIKNKIIWTKDYYKLYNSTSLPLEISKQDKSENLAVEATFWVHYNDGSYGVHMLYPNGDAIQGSKGLHRSIPVAFEKSDRILFGTLPLSDSLYELSSKLFGEDQGTNAIFWNILFLLICVILGIIIIRYKTNIG